MVSPQLPTNVLLVGVAQVQRGNLAAPFGDGGVQLRALPDRDTVMHPTLLHDVPAKTSGL